MTEPKSLIERLRHFQKFMVGENEEPDLHALLGEAADELEHFERAFFLFSDASMRGIKAWQAAHPGNDNVWPDQAKMVEWLMNEHVKMQEYEVRTRARRFRMYDALKKMRRSISFLRKESSIQRRWRRYTSQSGHQYAHGRDVRGGHQGTCMNTCLCLKCCSACGDTFVSVDGRPVKFRYACEKCGNKRCPHHSDHNLSCSRSNERGQPGSVFQ